MLVPVPNHPGTGTPMQIAEFVCCNALLCFRLFDYSSNLLKTSPPLFKRCGMVPNTILTLDLRNWPNSVYYMYRVTYCKSYYVRSHEELVVVIIMHSSTHHMDEIEAKTPL